MIDQSILIVDDDAVTRESLRMLLEFEGFKVYSCESGSCAVSLVLQECFDAVLVDYRMPGMNGDDVARELRSLCPDAFILGFSLESKRLEFLRAGADAFLEKQNLACQLIPIMKNHGIIGRQG